MEVFEGLDIFLSSTYELFLFSLSHLSSTVRDSWSGQHFAPEICHLSLEGQQYIFCSNEQFADINHLFTLRLVPQGSSTVVNPTNEQILQLELLLYLM